jgi:hypothetical protein
MVNLSREKLKGFHYDFSVVCWRSRSIAIATKVDVQMRVV